MIRVLAIVAIMALSGCVTPATDAGCITYGSQRATMPPLGMAALDEWVAALDAAMTGACQG